MAKVSPVYKKKECLSKENYRPVSILPCISKLYEGVMSDQLGSFMEYIFSSLLSAYRKQHNCQHFLIDLIEEWRYYLDQKFYVGAVLMDLSKAFDCLPHQLLIAKLKAYGLAEDAIKVVENVPVRPQSEGENRVSFQPLGAYHQGSATRVNIGPSTIQYLYE